MAKAKQKKSRELREIDQRRKIVSAELELSKAIDTIAEKYDLTVEDVVEVVKDYFVGAVNYVLNKNRGIK